MTLSGLANTTHTFEVRARDAAGNVDPTPASTSWTVDTVAPETAITSAPAATTNATSANFAFIANEVGASFECRLDGAAFSACASPRSFSGLANGSHTFEVRARDAASNVDATAASHTWVVDTAAPDTTITGGPSGNNNPDTATFTFNATEASATFECSLDGSAFGGCSSGVTYTGLTRGEHTFQVRARDAAGNVDATAAVRTWRSK